MTERGGDDGQPSGPPTGDTLLSYREILEGEVLQGLSELDRPAGGLLASGLSAGLDIGFSVFLIATASTLMADQFPAAVAEIVMANLYAVGFVFVVLGRSELFTEHTTLAVFPVLVGRATMGALARLWVLVYAANLIGAALFAALLVMVAPGLGAVETHVLGVLAREMTDHSVRITLLSGLLAGWLMGLMSWLVVAGRETISQIFFVWLVATSIGLAGLHHCIVGSVEVLAAVFAGAGVTMADYGHFLLWTTLGNAVGGVVFVAVVKYGHAIRAGPETEELEGSESAREPVDAGDAGDDDS